jgi:hypothetical protein
MPLSFMPITLHYYGSQQVLGGHPEADLLGGSHERPTN